MLLLHQWALEGLEYMPTEDLRKLQEERVKDLLNYAYEEIPFWRERISNSELGSPHNFINISDLVKIPALSKAELKRMPVNVLAPKNISARRILRDSTSGSTGEPFRFYTDLWSAERKTALLLRGFKWIGADFSKEFIRVRSRDLSLIVVGRFIPMQGFEEMDEIIDYLKENTRPKFILHSHASTLNLMARRIHERGINLRPGVVLTTSEYCSPETKMFIEEVFHCPVSNWYSSREVDNIAQICVKGSMHINIDQCVVEILDEERNVCPPNTRGRIALTFFNNHAVPFIRYLNGDCGLLPSDPCTCGISFPVLSFEGRSVEFISLPNGKIVHAFALMESFQRRAGEIAQYQIVREGPWDFRARISMLKELSDEELVLLRSELGEAIGGEAKVQLEKVPEIFKPGQKAIPFISLYGS